MKKKNLERTMQNTKINKHRKRLCKPVILTCAHKRKNDRHSPEKKRWEKNPKNLKF
jgi:hypothetical protein